MDKVKNGFLKAGNFLKTKFSSLGRKVIIGISAGAAVLVVSIILLVVILGQTHYEVLYTGVSSTEASEILTYARNELGISNIKINSNGDILVDRNQVEEARVQLSMANYPSTGVNYDVWKNGVTLFSSNTEIREIQKQQLEVKLTATFRAFANVDNAIVNLNIPDTNDYVIAGTEKESSAGIVLTLRNDLNPDQVDGMYNLVSNSVPGLKRTNITITDGTGKQLSPEYSSSYAEEESQRIEIMYQRMTYQEKVKQSLEKQIEGVLLNAFDDLNVSVGLMLNFDKVVTEKLVYSAPNRDENGNQVGIIANEILKSAAGGVAEEGGLIGTIINSDISPNYPTLSVGEDGQFYQEYSREINYKVNEEKQQIEKDGCSIDRLSASVVVKSNNDFTVEEETRWRNTIANAIGADVNNVSIKTTPFVENTDGVIGEGSFNVNNISGENMALLAIIIVLGIVLIVLLILALNAPGSRKKRRSANRLAPSAVPAAAGANGMGEFEFSDGGPSSEESSEFELASLNEETPETRDEALKREIQDFSKNNPEIVAQLIRSWIRSDE